MSFKCPVCNLELTLQANSYICKNNHVYDLSKHGYVNLIMANQKKSKVPGDSEEMIKSRNAFLLKGYYHSLSEKLNNQILKSISLENQNILDVGCGVGYYLGELKNHNNIKDNYNLYGIDISKSAIQLAAKRKTNAKLAVASAYNLPFINNTFDLLYSVFSPISPNECERVLKEKGILIMVGPGEEHLSGLTKHIYENIIPHSGNSVLDNNELFEHLETLEIKETIKVEQEDILNLVKMTPYYWQMNKEQLDKINQLDFMETLIHFYIKKYQKKY